MSKKTIIAAVIIIPILIVIGIGAKATLTFFTPYQGESVYFTINPGEGFSSINHRLQKQKLIPSARLFHYYTKYYKESLNRFKAGTYEIKAGSHMGEILETLTNGTPLLNKVTLPEGKNMYEMGKLLESAGITSYTDFIDECKNAENIQMVTDDAPSVEGFLFPETYKFAPNTPAKYVVQSMLKLYKQKTEQLDFTKTHLTPYQTIVLASIVEKETGAKWERPTIAGVYLNRLKKNMRLQADPTTIYGIWENYNGNLQKKHLLEKTDYNTYKINGLPIGPIANPSLEAIKAVLEPEMHNYVYFVSKNDGTHVFTATYKEHLEAVDYWQKNIRNRSGKSWRDLKQN